MSITPSFEEFKRLSGEGNLIPLGIEVAADLETPVSAYSKIAGATKAERKGMSFLLESVEGGENLARYSLLGCEPKSIFIQRDGNAVLKTGRKVEPIEGKDVFERIAKVISRYKPVSSPWLPPKMGGAMGYVSYDVVSELEPTVPRGRPAPPDTPEALFMITDSLLVFDHVRHTIRIICHAFVEDSSEASLSALYKEACAKIRKLEARLRKPHKLPIASLEDAPKDNLPFESNKTPEQFHEMVRRGKQYIYDGDGIQVVLSQRFSAKFDCDSLSLYRSLRTVNPSPYMFHLECDGFAIVGASPEVLAKCEGRKVTVRPIAGTRRRGATAAEDDALAAEMLADPKERAEHIMLVDLARNDVGRVSTAGSVKVDDLMVVERYSHVMHIVSNVTGELLPELAADSAIRASFPAGTLSGAPKVRAMQIINELEGERRGPYGGTVAICSFNGDINSCITIRTAVLKDGVAYFQSGAGIVADSVPEVEDEETRNKARAMMRSLSLARAFEPGKAKAAGAPKKSSRT